MFKRYIISSLITFFSVFLGVMLPLSLDVLESSLPFDTTAYVAAALGASLMAIRAVVKITIETLPAIITAVKKKFLK